MTCFGTSCRRISDTSKRTRVEAIQSRRVRHEARDVSDAADAAILAQILALCICTACTVDRMQVLVIDFDLAVSVCTARLSR